MAIDFKELLSKKNLTLIGLGVLGVALLAVAFKIVSGNVGESSRKRYSEQKAGIVKAPPRPPQIPLITNTITPAPTKGSNSLLPLGGDVAAEARKRPELPGIVESDAKPQELDKVLPTTKSHSAPPVPSAVLEQQLPYSQRDEAAPTAMPRVEVDPKRYLFNNQSPDATQGVTASVGNGGVEAGINLKTFSPLGESIIIATMSAASTRDTDIPIVAGVWRPFYFNGHKLLDIGDKIVGQASPGKVQGRATVKFTKIIFKNGKSMSINALGTDSEGNLGIPGVKVGDVLLSAIGPTLLTMASAITKSFEQSATQVTGTGGVNGQGGGLLNAATGAIGSAAGTIPLGLSGNQVQSTTQNAMQSAKNAGINGAGAALDKVSSLLATDMEENKPYLLIMPGTPCKALLMDPIDVSKCGYAQ